MEGKKSSVGAVSVIKVDRVLKLYIALETGYYRSSFEISMVLEDYWNRTDYLGGKLNH